MMKALGLLIAISVSGANLALGQTPGKTFAAEREPRPVVASSRIQLRAAVDAASVRSGVPIVVKLLLRNASSTLVSVGDSRPEYDYDLTVTDGSGKELPRTALGNQLLRHEYSVLHSDSHDLEPGQEIEAEIEITRIYQVSQPGTYYMRAVFHAIWSDLPGQSKSVDESKRPTEKAFSNPLQFTVIP
jgi:hypothetical protein